MEENPFVGWGHIMSNGDCSMKCAVPPVVPSPRQKESSTKPR